MELLFPELLRLERDRKRAAKDAKGLLNKTFFAGHLKWYGIPFKSNAVSHQLQQLLKDAVIAGKVRRSKSTDQ